MNCSDENRIGAGRDGAAGQPGTPGRDGVDGEDWADGADGAPCPNTTNLHNANLDGELGSDPITSLPVHNSNHTAEPVVCVP